MADGRCSLGLLVSRDEIHSDLTSDLVAVGRGDRAALHRVYAASSGRLFAIALRIVGDRAAVEDVLQETFIKVWNRAASYDPGACACDDLALGDRAQQCDRLVQGTSPPSHNGRQRASRNRR